MRTVSRVFVIVSMVIFQRKKLVLHLFCLFSVICSILHGSNAIGVESSNKIIAKVDKELITQKDLDDRIALFSKMEGVQYDQMSDEVQKVLRKKLRDQLIEERIGYLEGKRLSINISDDQVKSAISDMSADLGMSLEELMHNLHNSSVNMGTFHQRIRNHLMLSTILNTYAVGHYYVTQAEIDDGRATNIDSVYNIKKSNFQEGALEDKVDMAMIIIDKKNDNLDNMISEIYSKVDSGVSFDELVRQYSMNAASGQNDGVIRGMQLKQMHSIYHSIISEMEVGEVLRNPVVINDNVIIFKLLGYHKEEKGDGGGGGDDDADANGGSSSDVEIYNIIFQNKAMLYFMDYMNIAKKNYFVENFDI